MSGSNHDPNTTVALVSSRISRNSGTVHHNVADDLKSAITFLRNRRGMENTPIPDRTLVALIIDYDVNKLSPVVQETIVFAMLSTRAHDRFDVTGVITSYNGEKSVKASSIREFVSLVLEWIEKILDIKYTTNQKRQILQPEI